MRQPAAVMRPVGTILGTFLYTWRALESRFFQLAGEDEIYDTRDADLAFDDGSSCDAAAGELFVSSPDGQCGTRTRRRGGCTAAGGTSRGAGAPRGPRAREPDSHPGGGHPRHPGARERAE